MKTVNLLFTGGFDSTFRLCQLSRMDDVVVQPLYMKFSIPRPNEKKEIEAQDIILSILKEKKETKAFLLPPIRISENDLPIDLDYTAAFDKWNPTRRIPGQYCILGRMALLYSPLEIGREGPTLRNRQRGWKVGKTRKFLSENGVKFIDQEDGSVLTDFRHAKPGLELLFGRYRYPILGISETSMIPYIQEWGYEDLFSHTWTCDYGGKEPCGVCNNCETKWASGISNFVFKSKSSIRNHSIKLFLDKLAKSNAKSPVKFMNVYQLSEAFVWYVEHQYTFNRLGNFLAEPACIRAVNYKFQIMRNSLVQKYFDELIQAWNQGRKDEYLATLN